MSRLSFRPFAPVPLVGLCSLLRALCIVPANAEQPGAIPGSQLLAGPDDRSAEMMDGLHRYIERKIARFGQTASPILASRFQFSRGLREVDRAESCDVSRRLSAWSTSGCPRGSSGSATTTIRPCVADTDGYKIYQVRWPVLDGVWGEGLLLEPKGNPAHSVVALPDADQTPEQLAGLAHGVPPESQLARRLAEHGVQVLVPTLDRPLRRMVGQSDRSAGRTSRIANGFIARPTRWAGTSSATKCKKSWPPWIASKRTVATRPRSAWPAMAKGA